VAPSIVALLGAGAMVLVTNVDINEIIPEVEWPTLVFFMGLFVMVAGLVHTGVIGALGEVAESAFGDNFLGAATALLFGSAVVGAFVDNIPYTATMTPVVEGMVANAPDVETGRALWWAFALGACFSGNGTAIAASANVVAIGIAARAGHAISFWRFTRYGIVVTLLTTALAWVYVWLRYF
jgi:Na+/H+ antiporter NhaD/arsenite permease-like protein